MNPNGLHVDRYYRSLNEERLGDHGNVREQEGRRVMIVMVRSLASTKKVMRQPCYKSQGKIEVRCKVDGERTQNRLMLLPMHHNFFIATAAFFFRILLGMKRAGVVILLSSTGLLARHGFVK